MRILKIIMLLNVLLLFLISSETKAQVKWSVASGLRTMSILGENPNTGPMIQRDTLKAQYIGGGFDQINSGIAIMGFAEFGEDGDIVVPFGFEYTEMIARERIPISRKTTAYLRNEVIVPSALVGFNYKFYKFTFADVKAYAGIEIDAFFFQSPNFYRRIEYETLDSVEVFETKTKTPAARLGGDIKIGFDGNLIDKLYINASIGFGVANLMFRDDNRGELLTPTSIDETKESIAATMRFGLLLRYEF